MQAGDKKRGTKRPNPEDPNQEQTNPPKRKDLRKCRYLKRAIDQFDPYKDVPQQEIDKFLASSGKPPMQNRQQTSQPTLRSYFQNFNVEDEDIIVISDESDDDKAEGAEGVEGTSSSKKATGSK